MQSTDQNPCHPDLSTMNHIEKSRLSKTRFGILLILGGTTTLLQFFTIDRWRGVLVAIMALVFVIGLERAEIINKIWRIIGRIAFRKQLSIVIVFLVALITSMIYSWYLPPMANIADEFAYLHGAETFLSGRLTNPAHPMWKHFESLMVISIPTTSSKYPPAQSVFMAAGKLFTGQHIAGVWISYALACASLCWMLQAWTTPRWAFIGGLFAAVHPFMQGGLYFQTGQVRNAILDGIPLNVQQYIWSWSQSYWGGAIAMIGGCLIYGTLPRMRRGPDLFLAMTMATGLLILANSRPFEGLIVSIPASIMVLIRLVRISGQGELKSCIYRFILPLSTILLLGSGLMASYNHAVTGSLFRMPYQEYAAQYDSAPMFVFQKPQRTIQYRHEDFRSLYMNEHYTMYESQLRLMGWLRKRPNSIISPLVFFVGPFSFAMFWLPAALRRQPVRIAFLSGLLLITIHQSVIATVPHYIAPAACLIIFVIISCMRELSIIRFGNHRIGRICVIYLMTLLPICLTMVAMKRDHFSSFYIKSKIQNQLETTDGHHLVIVGSSTRPDKANTFAWVYNQPDIDRSKVIWAYDMGPLMNQELLEYFKDRKVWRIESENMQPVLIEYRSE